MENKNHPSETLPIDNSCQTGLPLFSGGVFIMKEIKLSQFGRNRGKYVALVDDEDFETLNRFKWCVRKDKNTFYAVRDIGVDGRRIALFMHCSIMNGKGVDHRDRNGLNNQKNNLRFCTNQENCMNRRKQENMTSIYKGVSFYKPTSKWHTQIKISGKVIHLGYFVSEVDAANAYNAKAIELFREFANINIIV